MVALFRVGNEFLTRQSPSAISVGALALILALSLVDHSAGPEFSFSIHPLYLLPVAVAAWYVGIRPAIALSAVAAGSWLIADFTSGHIYSHTLTPFLNTIMRFGIFALFGGLLASIRRQLAREERLSSTDPLTGLANSRTFYVEVERELTRAGRYGHSFSVIVIDLDNFKTVNDTLGHQEGDRVLQLVASTLDTSTRASDVVARLGGDEFVGLFPETGAEPAIELLETVRERLLGAMKARRWPITFSIGAATFETPAVGAQTVIKAADDLMYEVKRAEKNAWKHEVFRPVPPAPAPQT